MPSFHRAAAETTSPVSPQFAPASQTSTARTATLQNLGNGLVLLTPLYVQLESMGDEWFVQSSDLALVGRGETDLEALDDLRDQVAELFESLIDMRDSLGPYLLGQLRFLERLAGEA